MNPGIHEPHRVCPSSGALIFPPSPTKKLAQENKQLKLLLAAMVESMPAAQRNRIPAELLEGLSDGNPDNR